MIGCQICSSSEANYYLYTKCQHFICTGCAFQKADFSLQTIQCCNIQTHLQQQSMSVIIKSRRYKPPQKSPSHSSPQKSQSPQKPHLQQSKFSQKNITKSPPKSPQQQQISHPSIPSSQHKKYLQTIMLQQIQRIRKQFDMEHENLYRKEEEMINQVVCVYEEECRKFVGGGGNGVGVERFMEEIKGIRNSNKRNNQQNDNKDNRNDKDDDTQQPIQPQILPQIPLNKRNQKQFDYILRRLELNQQRMNEKLRKHQN